MSRRIIVYFYLAIFISANETPSAEESIYKVSTANIETINTVTKENSETGYTFTSTTEKNNEVICICKNDTDSDMATIKFILNDFENNIRLTGIRSGNMITIKGKKADKAIDLTIQIDERKWFQIFPDIPYGMDQFATGEKSRTLFWTISLDSLSEVLIRAEKKSAQVIPDSVEKAVCIHITINGVGSIFWGEDYFFRKTDGLFLYVKGTLKTKENETVIELIEER